MRRLFKLLEDVAKNDATVLIEGETGTGKELIAEEIHNHSPRKDGPFVVFDCGSVPRELIESMLFGHVKGSFTGAITDRRGAFAEAHGGTRSRRRASGCRSRSSPRRRACPSGCPHP